MELTSVVPSHVFSLLLWHKILAKGLWSLANETKYQKIAGTLQYCTLTRLEISYLVNQLC